MGKQIRWLLTLALFAQIGLTCGGIVVLEDLNEDTVIVDMGLDGGVDSDSVIDAAIDVIDNSDGDTCDSPINGIFNCCEGKPCRGWCDPVRGCICESVKGGCPSPTVCCQTVCGAAEYCTL